MVLRTLRIKSIDLKSLSESVHQLLHRLVTRAKTGRTEISDQATFCDS